MNPLPTHIAIIMDGNGRWARTKGIPREEGHRRGAETAENIVEACRDMGIRYLTLYAFSEENWQRPLHEVDALMCLLQYYISAKRSKMIENDIRFRTIGDISKLPKEVVLEIERTKEETSKCNGMDLILAVSYSSDSEIVRAVNKLIAKGVKEVTAADISSHLDTAGIPNPDLLIRTSGELRLSNFLLWQCAYTEFYFTKVLWPDFTRKDLEEAIRDYMKRERRFGGVGEGA
jgi:undecaprenyl diphosphate synthase